MDTNQRFYLHTVGITSALLASGSVLSFSVIDVPQYQNPNQPTSATLQNIRFFFSRGSHVFPYAAAIAAGAFGTLAYLTPDGPDFASIASPREYQNTKTLYWTAAASAFSIFPYTRFFMLPTANGPLKDMIAQQEKGESVSDSAVNDMLDRFAWQNAIRGLLIGASGLVGLYTALRRIGAEKLVS